MSRLAETYAKVSPKLAGRPGSAAASRAHAWLVRRSNGRLGRRMLGSDVLVLRTTGRRSGQTRDAPMFYVENPGTLAVVASNAASAKPPAWWLNLQAEHEAEALVRGTWRRVRGRRATDAEREALWPQFVAMYAGYDHYRSIATRELPVVVLEPR